ncbi:MAG: hypothetical protein HYR66_11950 [Sphingobacteriales bacterium]|nr:hypothetical protein [Sphingobacteriales bacterium]
MKDSWHIENFPFNRQNLRLSLENPQFDSQSLIFAPVTAGDHYDKRFTLSGWTIDSFKMRVAVKEYKTAFGDPGMSAPHREYSAFRVRIGISRNAPGLFWKLFLGKYVAFLIAYSCFYIHADSIDSGFGLSVGSLFAVIGNKYIIDSALPESASFTMADTLHGVTLFFIILVISCPAYSLRLIKKGKGEKAHRFDMIAAQVLLALYLLLNIFFIYKSVKRA